jgi:hypothetical protein
LNVAYIAATTAVRFSSGVLIENTSPSQRKNECVPVSPKSVYASSPEGTSTPSMLRRSQEMPSAPSFGDLLRDFVQGLEKLARFLQAL